MKTTIKAINRNHLLKIVKDEMGLHGDNCDLNHIDVSNVIDISNLFQTSKFNGDISQWNVSKVTSMSLLFYKSQFNGDISRWDVSNVTNMIHLFSSSKFNGDISKWDVSNVKWMSFSFFDSQFNGDISSWKPINLKSNVSPFLNCSATVPYWGLCKNNEEITQAINSHDLLEQLNRNLTVENKSKINKIKI